MAQMVKHLPTMQETQVDPWVRKILWRRKWQPTPVPLPGKFHGQRIPVGYSPWGCKEFDTTGQLNWGKTGIMKHKFKLYFPCSSNSEENACNSGDQSPISGSGRSSGEGNGNPFQYSCRENLIDREAWRATVHGVAKSWTRQSD